MTLPVSIDPAEAALPNPATDVDPATIPSPNDPQWYKDAVIYQLHLKAFFDSNNDGVGDFQGLIDKLDYIAELGVTAIWLLPFYPSPRRDDGYDIADYRGVHADYGDLDTVRRFVAAAHERDLKVIAELVINHTSDQHAWFQRARNAPKGSPERDFYVWSDTDDKYEGTRIIFLDTEKSNWTWDPVAGQYFWHRFYSHQPDLNFDNPAVMAEVMDVMRFWVDLGIDGLRLDAVPYLIEREGTNNENLPETHDILKQLRAEIDRYAPGVMLLAEANQWPEDAQVYFGEGDECHMSFHFPLMPRMYMAIAREDRFPITDIMRQTPAIPEGCQWAIFLRNHDELTLEMVTSDERDELWNTYAADRRARINLGIRRRLAPLLERDRRRIELMNGLLLSMPGTPVIYYGDEIGMGDNIFLGDRDGVRTPMQWTMDRNGGFSRADPARMVLPPIQDATYGFAAVNVETQSADQHSLLNWTRRMLAVRKRHRVFGRGTQRFLYPGNRKVLAYLREFTLPDGSDETILCVSNLSRTAQAVELDLSAFAGRVPVDLVGGSPFPPAGALPYLLTLPPYGFFWFLLSQSAALPAWHQPAIQPLPEYATIVMRGSIEDILQPQGRRTMEQEVLPAWLSKRRWFSQKGAKLASVTMPLGIRLPDAGNSVMLSGVRVEAGGETASYTVPLAIQWEDEGVASPLGHQLALARVRRGPRVGVLTDGFASDTLALGLLRAMRRGGSLPAGEGRLEFRPSSRAETLDIPEGGEIRRLSAEQSNSSMILADQVVLKYLRRVQPGIHPEGEMTRFLTEAGFSNTAPLLAEAVYVDGEGGEPTTFAIAQGFVRNQGDGWQWTLDYLARGVEELATTGRTVEEHPESRNDALAAYGVFAGNVGRRLAEMHAVLSRPTDNPDFTPEEADAASLAEWADGASEQITLAVQALGDSTEPAAIWLRDNLDALKKAAHQLAAQATGALRTRVHGDFHLGQVLVVQDDAFIIDFEGEPARTLPQRRARSSPLRDVAGLLRSFDYAAFAAAPGRIATTVQAGERRQEILESFRAVASERFMAAYREVLHATDRPWVTADTEQALLDLFLLEKSAYEIRYEIANRPDWLLIPLAGAQAIGERLLQETGNA